MDEEQREGLQLQDAKVKFSAEVDRAVTLPKCFTSIAG